MDKNSKERLLFRVMQHGEEGQNAAARDLYDALPKTACATIAVIFMKASISASGLEDCFEGLMATIEGLCETAHSDISPLMELLPPPSKLPK